MITRISIAPAVEPVTKTQVKLHLRLVTTAAAAVLYITEDDLLDALIETARGYAEGYTNRVLITQTWKAYLSSWPSTVRLPFPPFQSVTSIEVEGTAFTAFTASLKGILEPTLAWPLLSASPGADPIVITWKTGYGDAVTDVPAQVKQAILLLIGHWYSQREAVLVGVSSAPLPMAVDLLLNEFRWIEF